MPLTFQLPLPDKKLHQNGRFASRGGMIAKSKAVKAARLIAKAEAMRVLEDARIAPPRWNKARYQAKCFKLKNQFQDPDNFNASLKAYIDGLADAGIIANDKGLWPERPSFHKCDKLPRVEITITPEL